MLKFVLIVMLFNQGDGKLEFVGARSAADRVVCEQLFKDLGETPNGYRAAHKCIPIEELDVTLVNEQAN